MVRTGRGKGVRPLCKEWREERGGKGEMQVARASNE